MTRDEHIAYFKKLNASFDLGIGWLLAELEKEIERGRKLYESLDEINSMDDPDNPFQHLEISAKALEEYDQEPEK